MLRSIIFFIIILISIFFTSSALEAGTYYENKKTSGELTKSFIFSLVDKADSVERSASDSEKLLKLAKGFTYSYTKESGDKAFKKNIRKSIRKLTKSMGETEEVLASSDPDFYEKLVDKQQNALDFDHLVKEFVFDLIGKSLDNSVNDEKNDAFKESAINISRVYSELKKNNAFLFKVESILGTLPTGPLYTDEEIIIAFQEAMLHQNTLVKEYLVRKIQPRIDEFVDSLINKATSRFTTITRREELLKTSMNITQTYASLTGNNKFHRTNLKKVFTARLSTRMLSKAKNGEHSVSANSRKDMITLKMENLFTPNNIVIKAGESVRWKNNDTVTHEIRTIDFLSDGEFIVRELKPADTFVYNFETPGDYYYISIDQKNMYGKITVVD